MRYPLDKFTLFEGYTNHPPAADLAIATGTAVKSPMSGTVISTNTDSGYVGGKYVIIRESTDRKLEHYMGHHSSLSVRKGQRVSEGQVVAKVGSTGQATGPHVHYQIRDQNGVLQKVKTIYKNRLKWLKVDHAKYKLNVASSKMNLVTRKRGSTVYSKGKVMTFSDKVVEKNGGTYLRTNLDRILRKTSVFERSKLTKV